MEPNWSAHFFGGVVILDPEKPPAAMRTDRPPDEVRDLLYRIAKDWGCVCVPRITGWRQDAQRNELIAQLDHQPGCHYNPKRFFEPPPEIDEEALAERAAQMKKLRSRTARKYSKRSPR